MAEASGRLGGWYAKNRPAVLFVVSFGAWIGLFSLLFQIPWVDTYLVLPMTRGLAFISNAGLGMIGFETTLVGTIIAGVDGFAVNILKGCNGAYVVAIYIAAVLAFPATWKEKAFGALLGIPSVQGINLVRIISLYYIGAEHPALFERFHYHVWQTVVIILSLALWLIWAEVFVKVPRS
jgi:exosortase H (IPTLxxWG-CTERM-specific)